MEVVSYGYLLDLLVSAILSTLGVSLVEDELGVTSWTVKRPVSEAEFEFEFDVGEKAFKPEDEGEGEEEMGGVDSTVTISGDWIVIVID